MVLQSTFVAEGLQVPNLDVGLGTTVEATAGAALERDSPVQDKQLFMSLTLLSLEEI